jgi:hypothetical protein
MTTLIQTAGAVAEGVGALSRMTLGSEDEPTGPADAREAISSWLTDPQLRWGRVRS